MSGREERAEAGQTSGANVSTVERVVAGLAGGAAIAYGLWRRDVPGYLMAAGGGGLVARSAIGRCPVYSALGINMAETHAGSWSSVKHRQSIRVEDSVTIDRPPEQVYRYWHRLSNLASFMSHLVSVEVTGARTSHWVAQGPAGKQFEWDAEVIMDDENERIAWRSLDDADVDNAGTVVFRPAAGGHGTEVQVEMQYQPPAGRAGAAIAGLLGQNPQQQLHEDLRRFKEALESGEARASDGHSASR